MYGSRRMTIVQRAVEAVEVSAHIARTALSLITRQASWSLTDLYTAAATARFLAAHSLIDRAEEQAGDDPDTDLIQIRQPIWFGGTTIHEESD
ncbi:hypothetical protein [Streptomyces ziwulingensis]|uniref:Uncharacterized protein n=1 Tax=Streptomyces ziwulingensis TaxID=1045501 RepID=A0ABP9D261_9ACTN